MLQGLTGFSLPLQQHARNILPIERGDLGQDMPDALVLGRGRLAGALPHEEIGGGQGVAGIKGQGGPAQGAPLGLAPGAHGHGAGLGRKGRAVPGRKGGQPGGLGQKNESLFEILIDHVAGDLPVEGQGLLLGQRLGQKRPLRIEAHEAKRGQRARPPGQVGQLFQGLGGIPRAQQTGGIDQGGPVRVLPGGVRRDELHGDIRLALPGQAHGQAEGRDLRHVPLHECSSRLGLAGFQQTQHHLALEGIGLGQAKVQGSIPQLQRGVDAPGVPQGPGEIPQDGGLRRRIPQQGGDGASPLFHRLARARDGSDFPGHGRDFLPEGMGVADARQRLQRRVRAFFLHGQQGLAKGDAVAGLLALQFLPIGGGLVVLLGQEQRAQVASPQKRVLRLKSQGMEVKGLGLGVVPGVHGRLADPQRPVPGIGRFTPVGLPDGHRLGRVAHPHIDPADFPLDFRGVVSHGRGLPEGAQGVVVAAGVAVSDPDQIDEPGQGLAVGRGKGLVADEIFFRVRQVAVSVALEDGGQGLLLRRLGRPVLDQGPHQLGLTGIFQKVGKDGADALGIQTVEKRGQGKAGRGNDRIGRGSQDLEQKKIGVGVPGADGPDRLEDHEGFRIFFLEQQDLSPFPPQRQVARIAFEGVVHGVERRVVMLHVDQGRGLAQGRDGGGAGGGRREGLAAYQHGDCHEDAYPMHG